MWYLVQNPTFTKHGLPAMRCQQLVERHSPQTDFLYPEALRVPTLECLASVMHQSQEIEKQRALLLRLIDAEHASGKCNLHDLVSFAFHPSTVSEKVCWKFDFAQHILNHHPKTVSDQHMGRRRQHLDAAASTPTSQIPTKAAKQQDPQHLPLSKPLTMPW